MRSRLLVVAIIPTIICSLLLAAPTSAGSKYRFDLSYSALYESNIYHAFLDSQALGAQLNQILARTQALVSQTERLSHQFTGYADLNIYPSYSNRNRITFGGVYEPGYKYAKNSLVRLSLDLSSRNRDVLSDAGEPLARTLQKFVFTISLNNRLSYRKWRTEQSFGYTNNNYDDSFDSLGNRLTSYDYHSWYGDFTLRYRLARTLRPKIGLVYEERYYSERKTYPVAKGPVRGYGVIRHYGEYAVDGALEFDLSRRIQVAPIIAYTNRKDNFENFYGFSEWKYGFEVAIRPAQRFEMQCAFDYRQKKYPNYWTKNTGGTGRVAIDYATFEIDNRYELTSTISLFAYARNFNKVSNEHYYPGLSVPSFDYQDFTAGFGARYRL